MERIFVAEDDESIREELKTLLEANGYKAVDAPPCDLALLDVNLPGENGFEICRKLRMHSDVPVIFLTARDSAEDEIVGFGVGADDYIRKPYNSSVLLMRIARLLKRQFAPTTVRGLTLDLSSMTAEYGGRRTELTKNEARILACLMKKELCTKEEILEDLWNDSLYVDENTLYVNISRLREKLKGIGAEGYIRTVRGVGYRF
ncbi:MAG TPA: response regulator transcription factor [Candidatus Scatosoma pullicola]|nr:response regulator transcription factor [Candidatus Scatosoma pullicola]